LKFKDLNLFGIWRLEFFIALADLNPLTTSKQQGGK
jgi:hypothetical protein